VADRKRKRRGWRIRPRLGEAISAGAAVALFVLLFFPWYDFQQTGSLLNLLIVPGRSAWDSLELVAPLLALLSVLVLVLVLVRWLRPSWRPAITPGATIAVLGGIASLLVLFRILVPPDFGELDGLDIDVVRSVASFLGLAAALGITVGGYRTMRAEGSSFAAVADSLQPRRGQPASRKR
jgi:hypothetical protein